MSQSCNLDGAREKSSPLDRLLSRIVSLIIKSQIVLEPKYLIDVSRIVLNFLNSEL